MIRRVLLGACVLTACPGSTSDDKDPSAPTGDCAPGDVVVSDLPCDTEGTKVHACIEGSWVEGALCLQQGEGVYEQLNFLTGYSPAEWDYDGASRPARGVYGWSYYLRAFDLIGDTPVQEVGWGQWSKPAVPADGLDVCGIHPHGLLCDEEGAQLGGDLANCGHLDWQELEACEAWCCAEEDRCGVRGSIEGGMGYWMYTLATPHVKWMLPGATNANYEVFGGTFLHDRPQPCTALGGAVRVANRLLIPNDFVSFEGERVDGFLGYMLSRTPIGKRSEDDDANYWTIVIDTANFSGPVMYMSSWFWDARINWHPDSVSWSDPRALIGYIAQGFEGRIGAIRLVDQEGVVWRRTNRWAFPRDRTSAGGMVPQSTLFTGHSQYGTDWAAEAVEPLLAGEEGPDAVRAAAMGARTPPGQGCRLPEDEGLAVELEGLSDEDGIIWTGFGVGGRTGDEDVAQQEADAVSCHMRLALDASELDCDDATGWCEGSPYLRLAPDGSREVVSTEAVPEHIRAALALQTFEPTKSNDGRYLGPPAEAEAACFDQPGPAPADPRLYCTRTGTGNWIGFRWYRFIDQPELNQVFASIPAASRDEARCFMQARIENLHRAQVAGDAPSWFEHPAGAEALPGPKVEIDSALLVSPPAGLEYGFVPVPVVERPRQAPEGCDVMLGEHTTEPDPLSEGHYGEDAFDGGWYDPEVCPENAESGAPFSYPGTVFPAPHGQDGPVAYQVPVREDVGAGLDTVPVTCGLASDPPAM